MSAQLDFRRSSRSKSKVTFGQSFYKPTEGYHAKRLYQVDRDIRADVFDQVWAYVLTC